MQKANNNQKSAIHALVSKLGLQAQKETLVQSFTHGRETSSKEMWSEEANALIKYLKSQDPTEQAADRMRKKIIAIAHEMGWHIKGTQRADMKRIDGWCLTYGKYHRKLNSLTAEQLPEVVTQFEAVRTDYLNKF